MKNQIRAFIAVDVSQDVRGKIHRLIQSAQRKIDGTNWVAPQNLHITLKFLGDISLNGLPELTRALTETVTPMEPFELEFGGCGAFPDLRSPKTLWIGCTNGAKKLEQLAQAVEESVVSLGYSRENRRFSPHLTIGRIKKQANPLEVSKLFESNASQDFGTTLIDEVVLYSSELTRQGPIYEDLAVFSLKG